MEGYFPDLPFPSPSPPLLPLSEPLWLPLFLPFPLSVLLPKGTPVLGIWFASLLAAVAEALADAPEVEGPEGTGVLDVTPSCELKISPALSCMVLCRRWPVIFALPLTTVKTLVRSFTTPLTIPDVKE